MRSIRRYLPYIFSAALLFVGGIVCAQTTTDYLIVKDLPFLSDPAYVGLGGYLKALFQIGIGIAVTAAIVMLVVNGVQYMFSDIPGIKVAAKNRLGSIIWGLILAFSVWLILFTINPNLVEFDFITSLREAAGMVTVDESEGEDEGEGPNERETAQRRQLADAGIGVNKGPCQSSTDTNCTNIGDLPPEAIARLVTLSSKCNQRNCIVVTGGAEAGHRTHGAGIPMVDLRKTVGLSTLIRDEGRFIRTTCLGDLYSMGSDQFLGEDNHVHACLGQACRFTPGC